MREFAKIFLRSLIGRVTRFGTNGSGAMREMTAWILESIDDRRRLGIPNTTFTLRVGNPLERWRADTLLTKEPETIAWLNRTIAQDSVFYDVGANLGLYTLYACHATPGGNVRAVCFEPEGLNFARLSQNIFDNGLSDRVFALPMALGERTAVLDFRLSAVQAGRALHGEHAAAQLGEHRQGVAVMSLDDCRRIAPDLPPPTHLKIDVDGPELSILRGATDTLNAPSLIHLLVEITDDEKDDATALLAKSGFTLVETGIAESGVANHIFEKQPLPRADA